MPAVVLRYFPAVGRAQPLRHALADAGVDFDDLRVPLATWPARRGDVAFTGPFRGLPSLTWDGSTLGETLPIASFLARRLGNYQGLDDAAVAHLEGICSLCYLEVALRAGDILWADLVYPGVDLAAAVPPLVGRALGKLAALEAAAPAAGWFGGATPAVADCFAAEAIEVLRYLLGPARAPALAARLPLLSALADGVRARPRLARAWADRPPTFSARADEPAVVARLQELDLGSLG